MFIFNVSNARRKLSTLIDLALAGHEVVIACADQPQVRLAPYQKLDTSPRLGGQWADQVGYDCHFDEMDRGIF